MNFAVLPPETNSALMVAGAGQGPLSAAAAAWDGLAEEFHTAAGSFASVTSELAGKAWQGPAALAMTRVAGPYVTWLGAAAGRAEQAAAPGPVSGERLRGGVGGHRASDSGGRQPDSAGVAG
jgi:PPE-repeat protein